MHHVTCHDFNQTFNNYIYYFLWCLWSCKFLQL